MQAIELAQPRAENALLACLMNERVAPATALSMKLQRKDFAYEANALVFDAILRLVERGSMVDPTVLVAELEHGNALSLIGGEEVVSTIASSPYDLNMLGEYVTIIKDRAIRRDLLAGFEQCSRKVYSVPSTKDLLDECQTTIYRTLDEFTSTAFTGLRGSDLSAVWESRGGQASVIPYSWRTAQAVIGGRARGDLTIWGLYTSDGKSTIALRNVVEACRLGLKVGFFLLEMTEEQMTARLLCYLTGIDMGRLDRDELSLEDRQLIDTAFAEIDKWKLILYCDPSVSVQDIRAIQMKERFDLISIDYLQRFDFKDFNEIPRFAKYLKNLALTTKCSIDLFSQLTPKGMDSRSQNPFSKPDNNSLYGGKATAFEADNVIYLWAHRQMDEDGGWNERTGTGTLVFAKVRQGRPGLEVKMRFNANRIQWEEA